MLLLYCKKNIPHYFEVVFPQTNVGQVQKGLTTLNVFRRCTEYIRSTVHPVRIRIRKRAKRKTGSYLQENKKIGSRYTEVSVERTHSQIRNPAWTSFPVSYDQNNEIGVLVYLGPCTYHGHLMFCISATKRLNYAAPWKCSQGAATRHSTLPLGDLASL